MNPSSTVALPGAAGVALIVQNLLMMRITDTVSTVIMPLVINSSMGLALLQAVLLLRNGMRGLTGASGVIRPWSVLPGLQGSVFVSSEIMGYQSIGAASTIASPWRASSSPGVLPIPAGRTHPPFRTMHSLFLAPGFSSREPS